MSITGIVYWNMPRCLLHLLQSKLSKRSAHQVTRQSSGLWLTCHPLSTPKLQLSPKRAREMLVEYTMNEAFQGHRETQPLPLWAHQQLIQQLIAAGQQVMWREGQGGQSKTRSWTCKPSIISKQLPLPLPPTTQLYQAIRFPWRFCRDVLVVTTALCYMKG